MKRNSVILSFVAILLLFSFASAFAAGPLYEWTIEDICLVKAGEYSISVVDQYGDVDTVKGSDTDLKRTMIYFGVEKPEQLKCRRFSGDDLGRELNATVQWVENMTEEDKLVESLAKGLMTLKNFNLDKEMMLCGKHHFVKGNGKYYINKHLAQSIDDRLSILSNRRFELGGAKAEEFNILPKTAVYGTLSLVETLKIVKGSLSGSEPTLIRSEKIHRFTLSADCTNAVKFDTY